MADSAGTSGEYHGDAQGSGNKQSAHHAAPGNEHPQEGPRKHRYLPEVLERETQRNGGTSNGADDGRPRSGEKRLDRVIRPDLVEVRSAAENEGE